MLFTLRLMTGRIFSVFRALKLLRVIWFFNLIRNFESMICNQTSRVDIKKEKKQMHCKLQKKCECLTSLMQLAVFHIVIIEL